MAQFFKMLFASCLGVFLALGLFFLIGIGMIGALASAGEEAQPVGPNSVLRLTFDQNIPEQTNNVESASLTDFKNQKTLGLHDMAAAIRLAADDKNIKGILIEAENASLGGFASASTLRKAVLDFKKSGKFVVAHSKIYMQGNYYLSSAADQVYVNPTGYVQVSGFAVSQPFFKRMLDQWGVKMQIYYAGKFKGATEPYRLEGFSTENRLQYREFLNDYYDIYLNEVAASRKRNKAEIKRVIDQSLADSPERAVQFGLADQVLHRQEVVELVRKKVGLDKDEDLNLVTIGDYAAANPGKKDYKAPNKIAVLYAEGNVIDGMGTNGSIGDKRYVKAVRQILKDNKVKAIVLRVNSGGGSAIASENIWYALKEAKAAGKPLVVSMGDYAASGGYYIACMADSIFAEPNTLTGSIGVFRMVPSIEKMLANKIGITSDSVKTGPFATGLTVMFDNSPEEARRSQLQTEEMYEIFLKRVADGRKMKRDAVHEIAQGRVWTGRDALKIGLVDRLGGLDAAIRSAAKLANVKEYRTSEYPYVKDAYQQLIEQITGDTGDDSARSLRYLQKEMPEMAPFLDFYQQTKASKGFQARLPITLEF
jgi:protease IV